MSALASRSTLALRGSPPWAGRPKPRSAPRPLFPTSRCRGQLMPGRMRARWRRCEPSYQPSYCSRLTTPPLARHLALASCLVLHAVVRAPRHLTGAGEVGLAPQFHGLETSSRSSSRRETTGASHTVVTKRIVGWSLMAIARAVAPRSRPPAGWMHGQLRPLCPWLRSGCEELPTVLGRRALARLSDSLSARSMPLGPSRGKSRHP